MGIPPFRHRLGRRSLGRVTTYLIEAYVAGGDLADLEDRARAAAEAMSSEGHAVRYLRSVLVRADETCFHFFEAASEDLVAELARRAKLRYERIVEAEEHRTGRSWLSINRSPADWIAEAKPPPSREKKGAQR